MQIPLLDRIPQPLLGEPVAREEPCRICGATAGTHVGEVDYWDIRRSRLVRCDACALVQLDPMLTAEETARGCLAYYIEELMRTRKPERDKNMVRNFRRGVLLGHRLKDRGESPLDILEFGPGSGYFALGLRRVFPEARVTVVDVNPEVLAFNVARHGYAIIESALEEFRPELEARFDLVIARDVLEHVIDIGAVVANASRYCRAGGLFHFITPNGHEDVWKHYLTYRYRDVASELLINHVNYFEGAGLRDFLYRHDFAAVEYYTFKFKRTRRGQGWKVNAKLMAAASTQKDSGAYLARVDVATAETQTGEADLLDRWSLREGRAWVTRMSAWYHHADLVTVDPALNVGHEIFGLFRKGEGGVQA